MFSASIFEIAQIASSVIGAAVALFGVVFSIYIGIKRYKQGRIQQEREEDKKILARFSDIEKSVEVLKTSLASIEKDHDEMRGDVASQFGKIVTEVDRVKSNCVQHNQSYELTDLRKDVDRLVNQLDRTKAELDDHKQAVGDRYVPLSSYQGDMQMWAQTFNTFQQSIRDLQLMLNQRSEK
jgi:chromosome segregation ATPase